MIARVTFALAGCTITADADFTVTREVPASRDEPASCEITVNDLRAVSIRDADFATHYLLSSGPVALDFSELSVTAQDRIEDQCLASRVLVAA